jgi:hypothetical protein
MAIRRWMALFVPIAAVSVGCGGDTAPTAPITDAVTIYADPDFRGDNRPILAAVPELGELGGPCGTGAGGDWDDCVSSIRVPAGWEVTVYDDEDYQGRSMTFTADVADLEQLPGPCSDGWDDCISSIRVREQ